MKILVVGSGGREHALVWKLAQSPEVTELLVTPGSDAMKEERLVLGAGGVHCLPFAVTDAKAIADSARDEKVDLVVPGPEACLEAGLGDWCRKYGVPFAGPCSRGARFETSKSFQYQFSEDHDIPRPQGKICETIASALAYVRSQESRLVFKADGPALGKGVLLPSNSMEYEDAVRGLMTRRECGRAGDRIVIQEREEGEEISLHVLADAHSTLLLETARDYKRESDGDMGRNTGGMGGYSPGPPLDLLKLQHIRETIIEPWRFGCGEEGIVYRGILYPGLILTRAGPKVLEFNARFGDPETQTLMMRFKGDLAKLLFAAATDSLSETLLSWRSGASVCVVLASRGYPGRPDTEKEISGLREAAKFPNIKVFHAGTKRAGDTWYTNGGRVLGVTAWGKDRGEARDRAYAAVECIRFEGMHDRKGIGR